MAFTSPRICLDTCCAIELLKADLGIAIEANKETEVWYYNRILVASRRGDIQAFCSAFLAAELTHLKGDDGKPVINDDVKNKIDWLIWSGTSGLTPANITYFTLNIVREMAWVHGIVHKPSDLIHIATAIELGAEEFITYDGRIGEEKRAQVEAAYGLRIVSASDTRLLPLDLRQVEADLEERK